MDGWRAWEVGEVVKFTSGDETSWKRGESPAETRCPSEDLGWLRSACLLGDRGREAAGKPTGPLILAELGMPSHWKNLAG